MASRLELHEEFCSILGSRNVYFQPPESVKLQYPCIVYSLASVETRHADNKVYNGFDRYDGIVIDYDPDSTIPKSILFHFEMCSLDRCYTSDNLNHWSFTLHK